MKVDIHWTNKSKGLYVIKNNITGDIYVGSTRNTLYSRLNESIRRLRKNSHHNPKLQNSFNKYGEENFSCHYKIIENKDEYILKLEERFISLFKPEFNICLFPTQGGKPNLGRKLSKEWKENLYKNKNYKHSEEMKSYLSTKNKETACSLEFIKESEKIKFSSWMEAAKYFGDSASSIQVAYGRYGKHKGYSINKLSSQKKKIKLTLVKEVLFFDSASKCDKFLDIWKGATSFYLLRDGKVKGYKVEYID